MSYKTVTATLNLISTIHLQYPESTLISQLNDFYSFDQNIFLINSTADMNRFIDTNKTECTPKTIHTFESAEDGNITVLNAIKEITSKNTFLIVVSEKPTLNLLVLVKEIQRIEISMKIGIFISHSVSNDDLHDLFQWCWRNGIMNVFAAFCSNSEATQASSLGPLLNVFTFNPFGNFSVINVTARVTFDSYFLKQNANFQGHPIRTMILNDMMPRSEEIQVWKNIRKVLNASLIEVYAKGTDQLDQLGEMFRQNLIDCSCYLHVVDDFYSDKNTFLYPMEFDELLILVPEAMPYPEFAAYMQTVMSNNFCIYSIIAIVSLIFILTISRYVQQKKFLFFESAADVLNLIMNDNGAIKYQKLSHSEVFVIVPLTFVGLIVVNGVTSILGSYLTRPVMQPQINTLEDIYNSPYPILISSEDWVEYVQLQLTNISKHEDWSNKLRLLESNKQTREVSVLNTSISFLIFRSDAANIVESQERVNMKGYHIPTQVSLEIFLITFAISENFPFMARFNEIIHWMRNAGLYEKWAKLEPRKFNVSEHEKVDIERFPIPYCIAHGWALGCIVFVVEIVWKKFSCRQCQQRETKVRNVVIGKG